MSSEVDRGQYSPANIDAFLERFNRIETFSDGRIPLGELYRKHLELETKYGFKKEVIYTIDIEENGERIAVPVFCFIAPHREGKESLWILAGIHGEEPAGPNAVYHEIDALGKLGQEIPLIIMPLLNPAGYYRNWRFHDMPFSLDRRNVTDSRHLLPDSDHPTKPMIDMPISEISDTFTRYFLALNERYPIRLFFDLHEDAKLMEGYIYSQGVMAENDPLAIECARILVGSGVKLKKEGTTRFPGEVIKEGVVFDEKGGPVQDGSIDQLAAAPEIFQGGRIVPKHAAKTAIVPETPTIGGNTLDDRILAHESILINLPHLWHMASGS